MARLNIFILLFLPALCGCPGMPSGRFPNDPLFDRQWNLKSINMPLTWAITTGDPDILIAVADNEIDTSQKELGGTAACQSRYLPVNRIAPIPKIVAGHGTNVMRIIGSCSNRGVGLAGINWVSPILPIESNIGRKVNTTGIIDVLKGIAADPNAAKINVINFSFGADDGFDAPFQNPDMLMLIAKLTANGTTIVAASGNDAANSDQFTPASLPGVISVGATNSKRVASNFSNWGRTVDVMAPGEGVPVYAASGQLRLANGTSFAAPHVTGVISLMGKIHWKVAEYILKKTAKPMSCAAYCSDEYEPTAKQQCATDCCIGNKNICTAGFLDAYAAVQMARRGLPPVPLADADQYITYFKTLGAAQDVKITNRGGAQGHFEVNKIDPSIQVNPTEFDLGPGESRTIQILPTAKDTSDRIEVRTMPYDEDDPLRDEIVIYVRVAG